MPRDYDGFLRLLSFQTGHKPSTHDSAYALDRAFPAKLQADLIECYYENSYAWHQFMAITDGDPLVVGVGSDVESPEQQDYTQAPSYSSDMPMDTITPEVDLEDSDSDASFKGSKRRANPEPPTRSYRTQSKRKQEDESQSSILKKIKLMQDELGRLEQRKHGTALQNIDAHLLKYHAIKGRSRSELVQHCSRYALAEPSDIVLPAHHGPPIEELEAPLDGFPCPWCHSHPYLTASLVKLQMHCKKTHRRSWTAETRALCRKVKVQTFFRAGGLQRNFIVDTNEGDDGAAASRPPGADHVSTRLAEWQLTKQLHEVEAQTMSGQVAKTDKTAWFKRTGWLEHLANRNLIHLAHQTRLPDRGDERLRRTAELVELLVERSVKGLSTLARETRRWLRSAKRQEVDQRPMSRRQNPESQARYASYMVRFVCDYLRIVPDEQEGRYSSRSDSEGPEDGEDDQDDSSSDGSSASTDTRHLIYCRKKADLMKDAQDAQRECQMQALLKLVTSFMLVTSSDKPFSNALVHYLAMLGIDADIHRPRTVKNYLYILTSMVYCIRVLSIEKLLPAALRDEQTDEDRVRFLQCIEKYLSDGSYSPMSEALSLLAYGKHIAFEEGNSGNAYRSKDKTTFCLHGQPIRLNLFRSMAQDMVAEVEQMLWEELLWVTEAADRFSVKLNQLVDDVTFTRRGESFVKHRSNGLDDKLEWMLNQVERFEEGKKLQRAQGSWDAHQVGRYLRRVDRFLTLLMVCVHVTSGQPGSGS
ncbi:hypothetical protein DPSP01_014505 [Paraphaeosphaeria sporulosa]